MKKAADFSLAWSLGQRGSTRSPVRRRSVESQGGRTQARAEVEEGLSCLQGGSPLPPLWCGLQSGCQLHLMASMAAALLLCLLAAPDLPAATDYSHRLLAEWMYAEKLTPPEQASVVRLAAKWEAFHDDWRDEQDSRIFAAMEATWACEPGSAERDAAATGVAELQAGKVERWNAFVRQVRRLVTRRGEWASDWANRSATIRSGRFAQARAASEPIPPIRFVSLTRQGCWVCLAAASDSFSLPG